MAQAMTEGVYTIDMVQAIVRYSPTKSNRTPPPSRLTPTHLPLHRGGFRFAGSAYEIRAGGACRRPYTPGGIRKSTHKKEHVYDITGNHHRIR